MSTTYNEEVPCGHCQRPLRVDIADSISASRAPWMRDGVLAGTFHVFGCDGCGQHFRLEKELLYTDFDRYHWIGVFPPPDAVGYQQCEELVAQTFVEGLIERAPEVVQSLAPKFQVRVVFGLVELREKLLCFERGMDDHVLELLKLEILAERTDLVRAGLTTLLLSQVSDDGEMRFMPVLKDGRKYPGEMPTEILVARAFYDEINQALPSLQPAHGALFHGLYVNLLRYFSDGTAKAQRTSTDRHIWRESRP